MTSSEAELCVRENSPKPSASPIKWYQAVLLWIIPWYVFIVVSLVFALPYHNHKESTWVLLLLATVFFVVLFNRSATDENTWRQYCWGLCVLALGLATGVGLFTYNQFLGNYWHSRDSHSYANVLPSEDAAGYADAGKLAFADEARLDTSRALGYKDADIFCVAPILDEVPLKEIQFWAVGVDCCERRGTFDCDDAWDPDARSGVVVVSPDRNWHDQYALAVRQAEQAFKLASAPEPVFVRWVVDPDRVTRNYFRFGVGILIVATVAHGVISGVFSHVLRTTVAKKGKKKGSGGRSPRG